MQFFQSRQFFALLAALLAALTHIFVKIGVTDINSNMAPWIRGMVLAVVLTPRLLVFKQWVPPGDIFRRCCAKQS